MEKRFEKYKGIHPGIVLERELRKRLIKKRPFAITIGEHPQTLNAITKGRRGIPVALSLKIEKALHLQEGTMAVLQTYYDIKVEKEKLTASHPDITVLRNALFWDTDMRKIDWQRQFKAVIQRVFERGNDAEKKEITRFYGKSTIDAALKAEKTLEMKLSKEDIEDALKML